MLPSAHRLRRSSDFTSAMRDGEHARSGGLVVHRIEQQFDPVTQQALTAPRVGLVVAKSVGNSVMRHRVSRRLRAQLAARLDQLPAASTTVVRALPRAAGATSHDLGRDLDRAFLTLSRRR